jgi:hypothetical protein
MTMAHILDEGLSFSFRWKEPFHQEAIHKLEREEEDLRRGRGSTTSKEAPTSEKKEDTVGRVTLINGAMSSTLIG